MVVSCYEAGQRVRRVFIEGCVPQQRLPIVLDHFTGAPGALESGCRGG